MPKLRMNENETGNRALIGFIKSGMYRKGKPEIDARLLMGVSESTYYKRKRSPDDITLGQLRKIFSGLGATNNLIFEVFGRAEGGNKS